MAPAARMPLRARAPRILLLDHVGVRTGLRRTSPLMYRQDARTVAVVAFYPGDEFFQRNAKGRKIPIVILDPRS